MIKTNSKLIKSAYRSYLTSEWQNIYQAYKNPSRRKVSAWESCTELCKKYDGRNLKVVSKNCDYCSAGFIGYVDGKRSFVWITACYNRYMEV